jgi:antitoxin (DNA-binding transcriptional repressor) of toxin-antitoxin stability system
MTITMNMQEAKTNLSSLVKRATSGDVVYIANRGVTVCQLKPVHEENTRPIGLYAKYFAEQDGSNRNVDHADEVLFEPLDEEDLELWGL